jgi:hypothetical protein
MEHALGCSIRGELRWEASLREYNMEVRSYLHFGTFYAAIALNPAPIWQTSLNFSYNDLVTESEVRDNELPYLRLSSLNANLKGFRAHWPPPRSVPPLCLVRPVSDVPQSPHSTFLSLLLSPRIHCQNKAS